MIHFKTLTDMHRQNGFPPPENPLLSIIRCNGTVACPFGEQEFTGDFYMIAFKKLRSGVIRYGRTTYDHENGSMFFVKPRQVMQFRDVQMEEDAFMILLHEDLLTGHTLFNELKKYTFFEYETNEALHLSPREEKIIWELFDQIEAEYRNNEDEYSRDIILTHISSILKYAQRFYKRQFISRTTLSGVTVSKFQEVLAAHGKEGLPTVGLMASRLHLSPRYLSDLLKAETGKTAIELIHLFLIGEAKNLLRGADQTVAEIAYSLGFENLPYFSRLFKKEVGLSPQQYKKQHLN
ncbi:helix-turn-helix domain-containing protein [Dinghuibacter silviterrae]|uniref:Helix-turn-helix protein n=1 Tax=Dinghuibacter silviterrae TaxID=1539049 RepID=A0A4R8DPA4_9BACT|nr:helix-turn-helix domain-containing protein [Dinghuibacter silviterrae]TDW99126.1 helix-turn-helix protein [Dinghuibacter silviterrae]